MQNIKDTTSNFNRKYKKKMRSVSDRIMQSYNHKSKKNMNNDTEAG